MGSHGNARHCCDGRQHNDHTARKAHHHISTASNPLRRLPSLKLLDALYPSEVGFLQPLLTTQRGAGPAGGGKNQRKKCIPKQKRKIQENRKISIFSSPQNDENSRKSQNPDFSSHPKTAKISNFSSPLKSKNPGFFVPHSLKSARARRGSRSGAKRAEAGPAVQARKCAGGARQGKRRAAAHAILAEDP